MTTYRYVGRQGFDPKSAAAAAILTVAPIIGLIMAVPHFVAEPPDKPLTIDSIPITEPPPPLPPQPKPSAKPDQAIAQPRNEQIVVPKPIIDAPVPATPLLNPTFDPTPPAGPVIGTGMSDVPASVPSPAPAFVAPRLDPRYADQLQPPYPAAERRAGNEGRVVLRVLVGPGGRVQQVERVSATNDAFFQAAREQALKHWRFKPATRGGSPVEGWFQTGVRFELH